MKNILKIFICAFALIISSVQASEQAANFVEQQACENARTTLLKMAKIAEYVVQKECEMFNNRFEQFLANTDNMSEGEIDQEARSLVLIYGHFQERLASIQRTFQQATYQANKVCKMHIEMPDIMSSVDRELFRKESE